MAFKLPGRILETTLTSGTSTYTLAGALDGRYKTFSSELSNGDTCHYFCAPDDGGTAYEEGYGTYSGGTLARTTIIKSSNSNAAVNWAAGTKLIGIAPLGPSDLDATNLLRVMTLLLGSNTLSPLGLLDISGASAGQIKFPASQNASSNANTLDDYEEGTFTPTFSATSAVFSYAEQTGSYIKIGQLVWYMFILRLNTSGNTLNGNDLSIASFPFTGNAGTSQVSPLLWHSSTSSYIGMWSKMDGGVTSAIVTGATAATTSMLTNLANNAALHATNGSQIRTTGTYRAAA